jgi:hypothetical protein
MDERRVQEVPDKSPAEIEEADRVVIVHALSRYIGDQYFSQKRRRLFPALQRRVETHRYTVKESAARFITPVFSLEKD